MKKSYPTSMRLTEEAEQLLRMMSERLGISKTAVMEISIRNFSESLFRNNSERVVYENGKKYVTIPTVEHRM